MIVGFPSQDLEISSLSTEGKCEPTRSAFQRPEKKKLDLKTGGGHSYVSEVVAV